MPPKNDQSGKCSSPVARELSNLRKLLSIEKKNVIDLKDKFSSSQKTKEADHLKIQSDLKQKVDDLARQNMILTKKFDDQKQVLKNLTLEHHAVRPSSPSSEMETKDLEIDKLKLKNATIGLALHFDASLEEVKNKLTSDLTEIEKSGLQMAEQVERYKLLKRKYEAETSSKSNSKKNKTTSLTAEQMLSELSSIFDNNVENSYLVDPEDLAERVAMNSTELQHQATNALAKAKFPVNATSSTSVVELVIKQKVLATVTGGVITGVSTEFVLDDTQSSLNTQQVAPEPHTSNEKHVHFEEDVSDAIDPFAC